MDGYTPPKTHKKSRKKEYAVKIINLSPDNSKYAFNGWTTKYETFRAAMQGAENWANGRGVLGAHLCTGPQWEAHIIGPDGFITVLKKEEKSKNSS